MKPIAIDFFAGAGGLSEGLKQAGFNVAIANEHNSDAAATYMANHPNTKLLIDDIRQVQSHGLLKTLSEKPLLVAGGPPCQGFSMAGRRRIGDPRNHMFFEFIKKIKEIRSKFVLAENVAGIVTFAKGVVIRQIESDLRELGYYVSMRILNAVDFGVPQSRKRLFIFGSLESGLDINDMNIRKTRTVPIKDAISDLDFLGIGESASTYQKQPESDYQKRIRKNSNSLHNHESSNHSRIIINRFSRIKPGMKVNDMPKELKTKKRTLMRLDQSLPINTITTIPDDYIHYSLNRTLTVRECARVQAFPDTYIFKGPRTTGGQRRKIECPQYTQVGNAVPPLLAKGVGNWILGLD